MPAPSDLHALIHALTPQEKRYFRLYAQRHLIGGKSAALTLFEHIIGQEVPDDDAIRAHFPNEKFARNLPTSKYDLRQLILKSLHAFHSRSSIDNELKEQLHLTEILYKKGLYDQCIALLNKTAKKAWRWERFTPLLEIADWKVRLHLARLGSGKETEREDEALLEQKMRVLDLLENETEYQSAYADIHNTIFLIPVGDPRLKSELARVMENPILQDDAKPLTYRARFLFHEIRSTCLRDLGQPQKAAAEREKMIAGMEENEDLLRENLEMYVSTLTKLMIYRSELGDQQAFAQTIQKLRDIAETHQKTLSTDLQGRIFTRSTLLELTMLARVGEFERIADLLPGLEAGLEQFSAQVHGGFRIVLYYLIAWLNFAARDFRTALKWSNRIDWDMEDSRLEGMLSRNQVLRLLIHFELGNYDLLPYLLRSTYRFLRKRKTLNAMDKIILDFIKVKAFRATSVTALNREFPALLAEIERVKSEPEVRGAMYFLDLEAWIVARMEGISMSEAVKNRESSSNG